MNLLTFKAIFEIVCDTRMRLSGTVAVEQCCSSIEFFCVCASDKGGKGI